MGDYSRLLGRNRFRVHPYRWGMVATVGLTSVFNSSLHRIQRAIYGRRIDDTVVEQPPIFVIGHWRSGTTLLHEILIRDKRFAAPTTYQCFAPFHFVLTQSFLPKLFWFAVPAQRPMDDMAAGFDHPQEDEFALCAMGAPTLYANMAFPNHMPEYVCSLNPGEMPENDRQRLALAIRTFVQSLAFQDGRRLVLKSPPHTGRISLLAELFPGAKFIHMVRHPHAMMTSTRRLWSALDRTQGFQLPNDQNLDDYIFDCFATMYRGFEQHRSSIPADNLCNVRYEDLIGNPAVQLERIYQELDLGDFAPVRHSVSQLMEQKRGYRPNDHANLDESTRRRIDDQWASYMREYGYAMKDRRYPPRGSLAAS